MSSGLFIYEDVRGDAAALRAQDIVAIYAVHDGDTAPDGTTYAAGARSVVETDDTLYESNQSSGVLIAMWDKALRELNR